MFGLMLFYWLVKVSKVKGKSGKGSLVKYMKKGINVSKSWKSYSASSFRNGQCHQCCGV